MPIPRIQLPGLAGKQGPSPTAALYRLLQSLRETAPSLKDIDLPPDTNSFRREIAQTLRRMEQGRLRHLTREGSAVVSAAVVEEFLKTVWVHQEGTPPFSGKRLDDLMLQEARAYDLQTRGGEGKTWLRVETAYRSAKSGTCSAEAVQLLQRVIDHAYKPNKGRKSQQGQLCWGHLSPHTSVAILGGTAELSPAAAFLRAGADVLVINRNPEKIEPLIQVSMNSKGRLYFVAEGVDITASPERVAATIRNFAGGDTVHLGLFANETEGGLAPAVAIAQIAIARAVKDQLASVFTYRSPSMPTLVDDRTAQIAIEKFGDRSLRSRVIHSISRGRWFTPNIKEEERPSVSDTLVPEQKTNYHFAQFVLKSLFLDSLDLPVFAPVAPITSTRSMMGDPLISTALSAAHLFGVEVFPVPEANALMALLTMGGLSSDLRSPDDPQGRRIQVHGNIFTNPYALRSLLPPAWLAGTARKLFRV